MNPSVALIVIGAVIAIALDPFLGLVLVGVGAILVATER